MQWRKLGRIFSPPVGVPWMQSHASTPAVEVLEDSRIRVYFSSRDSAQRSSIGAFEVRLEPPYVLERLTNEPLVTPGMAGAFDDSGASMGCIVRNGRARYLYYVGWNLGVTVPWRNSIGLAIAPDDGMTFTKVSAAPIVDRAAMDPYSLSYPCVIADGGRWRMWYGSNTCWGPAVDDMRHVIKYAESPDGIDWKRTGTVAIDLHAPHERAVSRPAVVRDDSGYRMWYSRRAASYRLGYAESRDGSIWTRLDDRVGIDVSEQGWDSQMIEYPCVFDAGGRRYMLYNGNGYGQTGIGLAVLDS